MVRVFPGPGEGASVFTLVENVSVSEDGPTARLRFNLSWSMEMVTLDCTVEGEYRLPFDRVAMALPRADCRGLALAGRGVTLARGSFQP